MNTAIFVGLTSSGYRQLHQPVVEQVEVEAEEVDDAVEAFPDDCEAPNLTICAVIIKYWLQAKLKCQQFCQCTRS